MIRISCVNCQMILKAGTHQVGMRLKCPRCGDRLQVPRPIGEFVPPADPLTAVTPPVRNLPAPAPHHDPLGSAWEQELEQEQVLRSRTLIVGLITGGSLGVALLFFLFGKL